MDGSLNQPCRVQEDGSMSCKLLSKLLVLSDGEAGGIPCVAVKCVDIRRNTSGEGGLLDIN